MKAFIASFAKGQVLLLAPQPILLTLIIFGKISLYYSAPVIISLAVLWGWFDYSGKVQRRGASVLKKLERLVDDFGWLNFQEGGGAGNENGCLPTGQGELRLKHFDHTATRYSDDGEDQRSLLHA